MKILSSCLAILATLVVSACGADSASYMVDGNKENAFSLFRNKSYPGADWDITFAVTHLPECQRRYPLKSASSDKPFKGELFLNAEGDYFLHFGKNWYQIQINECTLQFSKTAPASPGDLVGTWLEGDAGFRFSPAKKP